MPTAKGKYFIIDKVYSFRLIEVIFDGRESQPIYKVYDGKDLVYKWEGKQDLHSMDAFDVVDSSDYQEFLDVVEVNSDTLVIYDKFGLPEDSLIGTKNRNKEIFPKPSKPKYTYQAPKVKETTGLAEGLKNSDTLVIHCADRSTEMLSQLYEGRGWDILRDGSIAEEELHDLLKCHSKVFMLGHGTPSGLINVQRSKGGKRWTVIDDRYVEDLKGKHLFVIWCNADEFFDKIGIGEGQFITGNIPSETWECSAAGCGYISPQEMLENITYWSKLCADVVDNCLNGDVANSVRYIRENYIRAFGEHPVTRYNAIRSKIHGTSYEQNEKEVDEIYNRLGIKLNPNKNQSSGWKWN